MRTGHAEQPGHSTKRGEKGLSSLLYYTPECIKVYKLCGYIFVQAFAEAAKETAECFQKDEAPFVMKNRLGLPVSVHYSEMFSPIDKHGTDNTVNLQDGETLGMDYSTTTDSDQFSAMISLSGKDYYIEPSKLQVTFTFTQPSSSVSCSLLPLGCCC